MPAIERILLDIVVWAFGEVFDSSVSLDVPPKKELGDFAFSVFPYAKITKLAPPVIAEKVAEGLRNHPEYFKDVSIMGGYVNFFLTNAAWAKVFRAISIEPKPANNETVVVDYIGANAGKPLHIGHICTPSIGQAILNTYEHLGYTVIGDSHFGDWGGIFGKLIFYYKYRDFMQGKLNPEEINTYQNIQNEVNKIKQVDKIFQVSMEELADLQKKSLDRRDAQNQKWIEPYTEVPIEIPDEYIKRMFCYYKLWSFLAENSQVIDNQCREESKKLSLWDEENVKLWKEITSKSINAIKWCLSLLNIEPKYNIGESFYEGLNLPRPNSENYPDLQDNMKDIVRELVKNWVATQNDDGSVGVVFPEETKIPSCVLQKKDGTGLYLTSDLAAIKYRLTNGWNPSKIVYCVDSRQQLHLRQAFTIARMAWPELMKDVELFHAFNGFIKLKEGAMSTRKGTVIFLSDLITEGFNKTLKILKDKGQVFPDSTEEERKQIIDAISIGAIKYSYLAQDREKDVVFDWDKALSFEGNSGPYIQYSFVRAKNIIDKTVDLCPPDKGGGEAGGLWKFQSEKLVLSEHDRACLRRLSFFGKAVQDSATKYKPHILANYCYELASEFNAFYVHTPKILEEPDEDMKNFRLKLIEKVAETLEKGFELLAIKMPLRM